MHGREPRKLRSLGQITGVWPWRDVPRTCGAGGTSTRLYRGNAHSELCACNGLAKKVDLSGYKTMLDIAGGSGAHAIGALQHWPHLKATVYEMSPVSGFVSEYAETYNLPHQLGSVTGDTWRDPFTPADLHFYSQVFHDWTPEQCRFLTEKSFAALPS
ncbi:MAG TPA: methyltransferase, partial [Candidatus Sulfotelmatobacter sp.]|nr:methyltransferase [Candidatus Sulfotelmatobacter sp.]